MCGARRQEREERQEEVKETGDRFFIFVFLYFLYLFLGEIFISVHSLFTRGDNLMACATRKPKKEKAKKK
jgi:hypothetical protein